MTVVLAAAVALTLHTNREHQLDRQAAITARGEAGRACVSAVIAAEQAFTAGTGAVAALAGTVVDSGARAKMGRVNRAAAKVATLQAPAVPALTACANNLDAPQECVHSAQVLADALARQEQQAETLRKVAAAAKAGQKRRMNERLTALGRQQDQLEVVVTTVADQLCVQASGVRREPPLPDFER